MSLERFYDRDLVARQRQIAREEGLLSKDSETPDGVRVVGVIPSLCENELYPWDPAVVKALRRLDPLVLPIGVKYLCATDAHGKFTVYRHALARMLPSTPEGEHVDFVMNVITPASPASVNVKARHPMIWLQVLEKPEDKNAGLPPGINPYLPFDWRLVYGSRVEDRTPEQEARARAEQRDEAKAKAEKRAKEEHDYRWDHDWKHIKSQAAKLDCTDRAHMDQPLRPDPKPFVHVRGAA